MRQMFRFSSNTVEAFVVEDDPLFVYLLNINSCSYLFKLILIGVYLGN